VAKKRETKTMPKKGRTGRRRRRKRKRRKKKRKRRKAFVRHPVGVRPTHGN
jgi:hypothetical protein